MNSDACDKIRPLLVDYSDKVLPADQVQLIADHLIDCTSCREELHLLEHSLELAREVWREAALAGVRSEILPSPGTDGHHAQHGRLVGRGAGGEGDVISGRRTSRPRSVVSRRLVWISGAVAICVVLILMVFGQTIFPRLKPSGKASKPNALAEANSSTNSTQSKEDADVLEYIAREARSARLAASVQLLADQPGLEQYKENAERYLKKTYADTTAVRMLAKEDSQQ